MLKYRYQFIVLLCSKTDKYLEENINLILPRISIKVYRRTNKENSNIFRFPIDSEFYNNNLISFG